MKKTVSLLIAILLVVAGFSITASAEKPEVSYAVDWSDMSFTGYWYDELKTDSQYTLNATVDSLSATPLKGTSTERRSFVANKTFEITEETKYEYVFQAKNDTDYKYCGVVFAFAGGVPYFVYGSFNNVADDPNDGNCDIRVMKGLDYQNGKSCGTGFTRSYIKVDLDADGYGTFKVVVDGYTASIYGLTDAAAGTYTLVGNSITLPTGAKIAFGAYYRGVESDGTPKTLVIRNAVLTALNEATAENIAPGAYEFIDYVSKVETDYLPADYTKTSFDAFSAALNEAKELIKSGVFDTVEIASAKSAIDSAVLLLEPADTDFSALEELVTRASLIDDTDCDPDAFAAMTASLEAAQAILEAGEAKQSEVDAVFADLEAKVKAVDPDGTDDTEDADGADDDFISDGESDSYVESGMTDLSQSTGNATDAFTADAGIKKNTSGCGASVALSSLVAAVTVGAIFVFRKKED